MELYTVSGLILIARDGAHLVVYLEGEAIFGTTPESTLKEPTSFG